MALVRKYGPAAGIALVAIVIAWAFAVTVLRYTRPMGLPLDDSYIYLTYAKQFGRGEPFSYFPGGGYSAGSTSVVWPMLLAPFWTLGARGHALVWVSYLMCTAFYAATAIGVWRIVARLAGSVPGIFAAAVTLGIAPFAWTALSGMEVAFASALLVAMILLLLDQPATGPPTKRLVAVLAASSLSRPEATLIVLGVIGVAVIQCVRRRELRAAAWWLLPLVAPFAWVIANKLLAGNLFPNTGVAKSHFYMPGFDWTYWLDAVTSGTGKMLRGLFWDGTSPLVWPKLFAIGWLAGAVRIVMWARREKRVLAGAVIVASPLVLLLAVIASSGLWAFQNYRYIAPAFPLLAIAIGCALAPPPLPARFRLVWLGVAGLTIAVFARSAIPGMVTNAKLFAQGAMDTNTQVVTIGEYLHRKLPEANVMFHDAGAVAYYGDGRVYDMLGLVTNHQAGIANHGAGSRFEFLESLPARRRFTHFAYYPSWLGTNELFGEVLLQTPLRPGIVKGRLVGDVDMQIIVANWDHVGSAELPLSVIEGWHVVDRLDVADLASERGHDWVGAIGRRKVGDPTARWSVVHREVTPRGLAIDGGRTIRGGREAFSFTANPQRPTRLVLRTGGLRGYPYHEALVNPVTLELHAGSALIASAKLPAPNGPLVEIAFEVPAGVRHVQARATGPYRAFHWFVLQQ